MVVVQGAVNPDEFYVSSRRLRAKRPAILRRTLGSKMQKMVFGSEAKAGKSTHIEDVAPPIRPASRSLTPKWKCWPGYAR